MHKSVSELLDIFLITFNRAKALDRTLEQLLDDKSPIKDFEINIIDNNSSDNTSLIVQKWQKNHPNLKYAKNKYNIGGNANIARTFEYGEKKYIWILCDDDYYNWDSWDEVENAIHNDKDAIVVAKYERPQDDIAQLFIQTTFLPAVIYKKELLDSDVIDNIHYNISNWFPHAAFSAKLINDNKSFFIIPKSIISRGNDWENDYVRGSDTRKLHPIRKDLNWLSAFANTVQMIEDKKLRTYISRHNQFGIPLNSARVFFFNDKESNGYFYNLFFICLVLNCWDRIKFIVNMLLYFSVYRILFIHVESSYNEEENVVNKKIMIRLLYKLKTKLYTYKKQLVKDNSKK